jgi:Subtilase family
MSFLSLAAARCSRGSHFSRWARIILRCGLLALLGVSLATCSQTSTPPSNDPHLGHCAKADPAPALRFWARDTLLVSFQAAGGKPAYDPTVEGGVANLIGQAINLKNSDMHVKAAFADPGASSQTVKVSVSSVKVKPFGSIAVAIVRITVDAPSSSATSSATTVDCIGAVVDTVNYAISTKKIDALDASGNHVKWLTGAAPDFYSLGAPGDYTGGSPSGKPDVITIAQKTPEATGSQLGQTTVFALDTYEATPCPAPATTCNDLSTALPTASAFDAVANTGPANTQTPTYCLPANPGNCPINGSDPLAEFLQQQGLKDHGRFVAAIIHRLAPMVDLRIIRVLNDSGVGTVSGLIDALHEVYTATDAHHGVVINLSLTVVPPPACLFKLWQSTYADAQGGTQKLPQHCQTYDQNPLNTSPDKSPGDRTYQQGMLIPLGSVINALVSASGAHQYLLVAAAGNDSLGLGAGVHLGADLPAGYCGVTAVASAHAAVGAAWPYSSTAQLSDFSNAPTVAPTVPGQQCVAVGNLTLPSTGNPTMPTVGFGTGANNTAVVARGEEVCSLFADSSALLGSDSGVAQWKGTSFATAFIAGNAARSNQSWPPQTVLDETSPCSA